jgi:hypothetical protein
MAEEDRRAAEYAVARAEQELKIAQARIQQPSAGGRAVEVTAPIDGVVLKRFRESEVDVASRRPDSIRLRPSDVVSIMNHYPIAGPLQEGGMMRAMGIAEANS